MLYGGKPQKPVPPSKIGCRRNVEFRGLEPYTYAIQAKQPGSNYKIRQRDTERARLERLRISNEDDLKKLTHQKLQKEVIDVADKKHVYYQIKRAVECGMKANTHLFEEERPKPKLMVEDEPEQPAKTSKEDLEEKVKKLKILRDEKQRKIVEEKRLQQFIQNSEELRSAEVAKREKDIGKLNLKIIQENERVDKERKIKKIELANLENLEIFKQQSLTKKEEREKCLEKKKQFRKELHEQVQQLEEIKNQQKMLKKIECDEMRKLNEQLNEEEKIKKLDQAKSHMQRIEDLKRFTDEKMKLFSKMNEETAMFDDTLAITMAQNIKDDKAEEIDKKIRIRLETDKFLRQQAAIKEERKKENEKKLNKTIKELNEMNELERSVERERAEARRKRIKEENQAIKEQLKLRETLLEEQKNVKYQILEQSAREYDEYLKEKKQVCEEKTRLQSQFRKELIDQINSRSKAIEK